MDVLRVEASIDCNTSRRFDNFSCAGYLCTEAIPNCEIHLRHVKNQANKLSRNHVSPL